LGNNTCAALAYVWLVLFDPQNLGRGKTSQCHIAGDLDEFFPAHPRVNFIALGLCALVVP
jgi:hypothetical protein